MFLSFMCLYITLIADIDKIAYRAVKIIIKNKRYNGEKEFYLLLRYR